MTNFKAFDLPESLQHTLAAMNFLTPTPIQEKAIPLALAGRDIIGSAQTGTGKTGAFAIPLITKLLSSNQGIALILTPTRELAAQVMKVIADMLGRKTSIRTAVLIGGDSMGKQLSQLRNRPRIIVGTPGRVNDHLRRGSLNLSQTEFLVLDETDRMLDMGFGIQLDAIAEHLPNKRQTMMFSATLSPQILKIAGKYLSNPERITVGSTTSPIAKISQELIHVNEADKYSQLVKQLNQRDGSIIVFVGTKRGAEKLTDRLRDEDHSADVIHGDLRQSRRERVIENFRRKKYRIMVATDVAARGLDIPHIEHVINFNLPQCPEDYIHRIGRTARAGAEGAAVCFLSPGESKKWHAIHRLINPGTPLPAARKGSSSNNNERRSKNASFAKPERPFKKKEFGRKPFAKTTEDDGRFDSRSSTRSPAPFKKRVERSERFEERTDTRNFAPAAPAKRKDGKVVRSNESYAKKRPFHSKGEAKRSGRR